MTIIDSFIPVSDDEGSALTVIYGKYGVGKTSLAADISNNGLIIVTSESGHRTLKKRDDGMAQKSVFKNFTDMDMFEEIMEDIADGKFSQDILLLDTISGLHKTQLRSYMDPGNPNYLATKRPHRDIPAQADYLLGMNKWYQVFEMLATQNLIPVIINCHVDEVHGQAQPLISDSIYQAVHGLANMVSFMYVDAEGTRQLVSTTTSNFIGKNQLDVPDVCDAETYVREMRRCLKLS